MESAALHASMGVLIVQRRFLPRRKCFATQPAGLREALNWSATRQACFKPQLFRYLCECEWSARGGSNPFAHVCKQVLLRSPPCLSGSRRRQKYMFSMRPTGDGGRLSSTIDNFHSASSSALLYVRIGFPSFINIHSECHACD